MRSLNSLLEIFPDTILARTVSDNWQQYQGEEKEKTKNDDDQQQQQQEEEEAGARGTVAIIFLECDGERF